MALELHFSFTLELGYLLASQLALQFALSRALALRISKVFPLVFLLCQELEMVSALELTFLLAF